jgi:rare lipoprotein A (peptidoglycan hydrolase)
MRPTPGLHRQLKKPRLAGLAIALASAIAGLLLSASGSLALSGATQSSTLNAHRHPGYHRGIASWYKDDGLKTACGFHAKFGVAHRSLPCGTHVTFWHDHRRVVATVDDRGPYVTGRTWDLDEHTASALHMLGVEGVWAKW